MLDSTMAHRGCPKIMKGLVWRMLFGVFLFGAGFCSGLVFSRLLGNQSSSVECPGVPKVFSESTEMTKPCDAAPSKMDPVPPPLDVTQEELEDLKRIAASRGETNLPPQALVDNVYRRIKKARAAKKAQLENATNENSNEERKQ